MKSILPLVWKLKWLIAAAAVVAATVTYALTTSSGIQIWSGRAVMRIGMAPASDYLVQKSGTALVHIETPRRTIARLSDPAFREKIIKRAAFEPATETISRSMVASSMRGIELDKSRDVAIELSAGSPADVRAAFRSIATEIGTVHGQILDRQVQVLLNRIEADKVSIAANEKVLREFGGRFLAIMPPATRNEFPTLPVISMLATTVSRWAELETQARSDATLKQLYEPTVLRIEAENLIVAHRSIDRLRNSLLAGAGMLLAMIFLTIVVSPPARGTER